MNNFKAFMSYTALHNNKQNQTAKFGELTTYSKTFTRDMREYARPVHPDTNLFLFKCEDEMLVRVEPSVGFMDNVVAFGQWMYNQHQQKLIPNDSKKAVFIQSIQTEFPRMNSIVIGEIMDGDTLGKNMPDYVQYKMLDGQTQYQLTIWFSGPRFDLQYDESEIFMVPPLPNVKDLIDTKAAVDTKLKELPSSYDINRIMEIRGDKPETGLIAHDLRWHDPNNPASTLITTWKAVVYGAQGLDTEAIKEAIREILDENPSDKWPDIYPDLYSESEFALFPVWDSYALRGDAFRIGTFSSSVVLSKYVEVIKRFLPSGYNQTDVEKFIAENATVVNTVYRTLSLASLGNPNNKDNTFKLNDLYPDYMSLPTSDPDFKRQEKLTQEFSVILTEALDHAYNFNPNDTIDPRYTRVLRRGHYFLSFQHNAFNFLILTKFAYERAYG